MHGSSPSECRPIFVYQFNSRKKGEKKDARHIIQRSSTEVSLNGTHNKSMWITSPTHTSLPCCCYDDWFVRWGYFCIGHDHKGHATNGFLWTDNRGNSHQSWPGVVDFGHHDTESPHVLEQIICFLLFKYSFIINITAPALKIMH